MAKDLSLKYKWVKDSRGKRVRIPECTDLPLNIRIFDWKVAEKISELAMQGNTLKAISEMPGMPPVDAIYRWIRDNASFKVKMKEARALRGLYFEEKALEVAGAAKEHNVQSSRLKVDTYKWAAEVNAPETYGKKTTISGDKDAPIRFVISTGFPEPNEFQKHPELGEDGLIKKVEVLPKEETP